VDTQDLVRVLKEVPECRLRIIELAWEVVGNDGIPDADKLGFHHKELKEALDEAGAYEKATKGAVLCLINMDQSQP